MIAQHLLRGVGEKLALIENSETLGEDR